jgi:hypothetical protein
MAHPAIKGEKVLAMAAEPSISDPAVLILHGDSSHARRTADHLAEFGLDKAVPESDGATMVPTEAQNVADLLREHAGVGGNYVAEILENNPLPADYIVVELMDGQIGFASYLNDNEMVFGTTRYDQVDRFESFELAKEFRAAAARC